MDLNGLTVSPRANVPRDPHNGLDASDETTRAFSLEVGQDALVPRISTAVDYCTSREIARGGMGRIYCAEDPLLEREVALKVSSLKAEQGDSQFLREAQVLAKLAHPNIVPVHVFGKEGPGRPFYSMKLVKGQNLRAILKDLLSGDAETTAMFTRQRLLEAFRKVCDAVSFAHSKGFLHRDLKPENIMIGEYGEVLVMDWGLAKVLRSHPAKKAAREGDAPEPESLDFVEGTPQYMSPEQAVGMYGGLDERSDIYSLGGILFSILTLQPPVSGSSVKEVLQKVREGKVETLTIPAGSLEGGGPKQISERIPEALRAITLKALSKDREKRYESVHALGADIEAYQGGFATSAEQANLLRLLVLLIKRHRAASVLALLMCLGAIWFTVRLAASEKRAVSSEKRAVTNAEIADQNAQQARIEKEATRRMAARAQTALAEAAEENADPEQMRIALDAVSEDLRDATWRYLNARVNTPNLVVTPPDGTAWVGMEDDPNNPECMFTLRDDGAFSLVNIFTGQIAPLWSFQLQTGRQISKRRFGVSRDGSVVVVATETLSNGVTATDFEIRQVNDGSLICKVSGAPLVGIYNLWISPEILLVSTHVEGQYNKMTAFDTRSGGMLWEKLSDGPRGGHFVAGFAPDGKTVFLLTTRGMAQKLDARSGQVTSTGSKSIQPQGGLFTEPWTASTDWKEFYTLKLYVPTRLRRFDAWAGELKFEGTLLPGIAGALAVLPKNNLVACVIRRSEQGCALQIFDKNSGVAIGVLPFMAAISPYGSNLPIRVKGDRIAVQFFDKILVWSFRIDRPTHTYSCTLDTNSARILGDTERIVFTGRNSSRASVSALSLGENQSAKDAYDINLLNEEAHQRPWVSTSIDGSNVLIGLYGVFSGYHFTDNVLQPIWSAVTHSNERATIPFVIHPREDLFWAGDWVGEFSSGKVLTHVNREGLSKSINSVVQIDWIGRDRVVEIVGRKSSETIDDALLMRGLRLWNAVTGEAVLTTDAFHAVAVSTSPDGTLIAEAGDDKRLRLRNSKTLEVEMDVRVHDEALNSVTWHPSLPFIVTTSADSKLRIWDVSDFKMVREYRLRLPGVDVRISPNGKNVYVKTGGKMAVFTPECFQP